jgi:autotransporter-associated beta strand protein
MNLMHLPTRRLHSATLVAIFYFVALAGFLRAQTPYVWTGATSGDWNVAGNWQGNVLPPTSGNNYLYLVGGTPNNTHNVSLDWTVTGLWFNSGALVLGGQTIRFNDSPLKAGIGKSNNSEATVINNPLVLTGPTTFYTDSGAITLAGQISGPGAFNKRAPGTVVASGTNSYLGGTTISGGVLSVGSDSALGTSFGPVFLEGGTLLANTTFSTSAARILSVLTDSSVSVAADSTFTTNGPIFGTGQLTKIGTGTLVVKGFNGTTGAVRVAAGVLEVANPAQFGLAISSLILDGGTLRVSGNMVSNRPISVLSDSAIEAPSGVGLFAAGTLSGAGQLTKLGAGGLSLRGTNGMTGVIRISAGMVDVDTAAHLGTSISTVVLDGGMLSASGTFTTDRPFSLMANSDLKVTNNSTLTASGVFSGSGILTKKDSGTLLLTGSNSNSGGITIAGGTIAFGTMNAIGGSGANVTVQTGALAAAKFAIDQTFLDRINPNSRGAVALGVSSSNPLDFSTGGLDYVSLGAANSIEAVTYSGTLTPGASGYHLGGGSSKLIVSTNLSGTSALTVVQGGKVVLSGTNNTYSGGTMVNSGGMLYFTNVGAIAGADRSITVLAGGAVGINSPIAQTFLDRINSSSTGAVTLGADSSNNLNFSTGELGNVSLGAAGQFTYSGVVSPGGSGYRFGGVPGNYNNLPGTLTLSQGLVGNNNVTIAAGGVVVFAGNNTYSGNTTIAGGTLSIAADNLLSANNGSVSLNSGGALLASGTITSTRGATLGSGGGGFSVDATRTLTWNGVIAGTGRLSKSGSGTLTLGSGNTYSGGTTLLGGNLVVGADNQLGEALTRVTFDGGTLEISSNLTTSRPSTLNVGGGYINTPGILRLDLNGAINGAGKLTKIGTGTLALGGANIYVGDTYVKEGTLLLTANNALSPNTRLIVDSDASFDANGFAQTFSDLEGSGKINVGSAGLGFQPTGSSSYAGQMQGTGGFTMSGAGVLTLTGNNTYGGTTAIEAGTVKLGAAGALPPNTPLQLSAGAMLDLNGNAVTVGQLGGAGYVALGSAALTVNQSGNTTFTGVMQGTGGFNKQGDGMLTLSGDQTFSGASVVSAGELKVNGSAASSPFTISGGILSGSGTVGTLTIASGGTLSPGSSPGVLNVSGDLSLAGITLMELSGLMRGVDPGYDAINVTGAITFGGTLNVIFLDSYNPVSGSSFDLFDAHSMDGSFLAINLPSLTNGLIWETTALYSTGVLSVGAVPEPSTYAAFAGLVALGFVAYRRRRNIA